MRLNRSKAGIQTQDHLTLKSNDSKNVLPKLPSLSIQTLLRITCHLNEILCSKGLSGEGEGLMLNSYLWLHSNPTAGSKRSYSRGRGEAQLVNPFPKYNRLGPYLVCHHPLGVKMARFSTHKAYTYISLKEGMRMLPQVFWATFGSKWERHLKISVNQGENSGLRWGTPGQTNIFL